MEADELAFISAYLFVATRFHQSVRQRKLFQPATIVTCQYALLGQTMSRLNPEKLAV